MPILKQLVSGSSHTKRRSRMDLTREMISAPLGDFRHTMHVGRSGDAFGDTSFLGTRSGEPPPEAAPFPRSPRPGLLSRTFRSSKRSQSVTRVDQQHDNSLTPPTYVKNAMSLPFLNDEVGQEGGAAGPSCSLSSSPLPLDGTAAAALLEREERSFGALAELPEGGRRSLGGMKHAESVMSFHVDLGPSMLGDILGVMVREDDDLGYEEGHASPAPRGPGRPEEAESGSVEQEEEEEEQEQEEGGGLDHLLPASVEPRPSLQQQQQQDSCSVSSCGSAALDDSAHGAAPGGDTDSATFSVPAEEESNFSSFLEDEDDEIRV